MGFKEMKKKAKLGDKFVVIGNSGGDHSFSKYDIVTLSIRQCDGIHMYVDREDMFGFVPDADLVSLKTVKKLGMKYLSKQVDIETTFIPTGLVFILLFCFLFSQSQRRN